MDRIDISGFNMVDKDPSESEDAQYSTRRTAIKLTAGSTLSAFGLSGVSVANAQNSEETNLKKQVLADTSGVRVTWVSVNGVKHLFREHKTGSKEGSIEHTKLGKEGPEASEVSVSSSLQDSTLSGATDSVTTSDYNYSDLVIQKKTQKEFIGGCRYYNNYDHIWGAIGYELTDPVSVLSKNTLAGLIGLALSGGWGFVAGTIAGTVLSLYSDDTFSVIANDVDTPYVEAPRMDLLASGEFDPEVGDGAGIGTYNGHMNKDPVWYFI
jgi:hypothetical protein